MLLCLLSNRPAVVGWPATQPAVLAVAQHARLGFAAPMPHQPCLTLPTRYGEHEALRLAKADGMHWLLHLDPDELLHTGEGGERSRAAWCSHSSWTVLMRNASRVQLMWEINCKAVRSRSPSPAARAPAGGPAFSLPAVLARQPPHVPALRFMNFEGQPEAGDLTNRIEQVGALGRQTCMCLM